MMGSKPRVLMLIRCTIESSVVIHNAKIHQDSVITKSCIRERASVEPECRTFPLG